MSTGAWRSDYAVHPVMRIPARLLLVLAAAAASCATLEQLATGAFQKPTLAYKSAALTDVSLSGATLNIVTTVDNPNGVALSLAELDYRLSIDGHPVATGKPPEGLEIPAHGSADVTLPATFQFADLGQAVATLPFQGERRVPGRGHGRGEDTGRSGAPAAVTRGDLHPSRHAGDLARDAAGDERGHRPRHGGGPGHPDGEGKLPGAAAGARGDGERRRDAGGRRLGEGPRDARARDVPIDLPAGRGIPFAGALEAAQAVMRGGTVPIALDGQLQSGPAPVPFSVKTTAQFRR